MQRTTHSNWFYALCHERHSRRRAMLFSGVISLLFIALVAFFSFQAQLLPYDEQLSGTLRAADTFPITPLAKAVSFAGYAPWNFSLTLLLGALVALWLGWQVGLYLLFITAFQGLITVLLRYPIRFPRPMDTDLNAPLAVIANSSFPSGHVAMYIVLFGFTLYLLYRHGAPPLLRTLSGLLVLFLTLLVGPARIHLGAHWVADVIGSYLLGVFLLLLAIEIYERWLWPWRCARKEAQ